MDNELIGDDYSLEEKKFAEKLSKSADPIIFTSLWQILFKGIDELKVASEPITSLEMLLFRACHMSILPSPDVLIKTFWIMELITKCMFTIWKGSHP